MTKKGLEMKKWTKWRKWRKFRKCQRLELVEPGEVEKNVTMNICSSTKFKRHSL